MRSRLPLAAIGAILAASYSDGSTAPALMEGLPRTPADRERARMEKETGAEYHRRKADEKRQRKAAKRLATVAPTPDAGGAT